MWTQMPVLARASPSDKFNLISGIKGSHHSRQHQGEVLAVTGSGVHDGGVLALADVGYTMVSIHGSIDLIPKWRPLRKELGIAT